MRRWLLALLLALSSGAHAEKVLVLSYYNFLPFADGAGGGLSADLCRLLEARSQGRYQFELQIVPRRRLEVMLTEPPAPILVPWIAPKFFAEPQRYQWGGALMQDTVLLLSVPGKPVRLEDLESLRGLRFGGMLGHRYDFGLLERALKEQVVLRADSAGPEQNYLNLMMGRVDFTIMPESTLHTLRSKDLAPVKGKPEPQVQPVPGTEIVRSYFSVGADEQLRAFLRTELDAMRVVRGTHPAWAIQVKQK